jgi:hypothetical protein
MDIDVLRNRYPWLVVLNFLTKMYDLTQVVVQ